jgi:hypothetical protein
MIRLLRLAGITVVLGGLLVSGCASSRNKVPRGVRLAVGNGTDQVLTDVVVSAGSLPTVQVARLDALAVETGQELRGGDLPDSVTLAWLDAKGEAFRRDIPLADRPSGRFVGRLFVEVQPTGEPKVFYLVDSGRGASGIPWSAAPTWQGLPSIPGLSGD